MARLKVCDDGAAIVAISRVVGARLGRGVGRAAVLSDLRRLRLGVWDDRPRVVRVIRQMERCLSYPEPG